MLTLVLCLSLVACGNSDDVAGDDWRTTGMVVGSGTITHDGESVDVLVTVSESSAAFYRDLPEQILFDSVSFPMNIPDAEQAFNAISFDDMDDDGESDVLVSFIHENGDATELIWIWDPVERYVFREDLSTVAISGGDLSGDDLSEYVGLWEYQGENLWLRIHEDATWEFVNDQDEVIEYGVLWVDEYGITLHFDGSGDTLQLDRTVSGDLIDSVNGGTLVPADKIESCVPYFTRNGFEINAAVDAGTYLLKNGACSYYNLGKNYTVGDCYWEVIKNYDVTHDGIREIQFDAVCYVPASSLGTFDQEFIISTRSGLYDFYTGKWFNTDNDHTEKNHTERIDNHYVNTLEWNGQSYEVEYSYSTEAEFFVADWYMVYTVSYMVYLPEGYDGLLFVAEPEAKTYEDHMKWSDPTAEYYLTEEDAVDLFFSVCY
ncbi:hypothetical protein [Zongyangia hominis]|uniref:hypothetical protein n=1 Tax=Zongyangia hominis TaxID=2763677 RepID=UPI0021CCCFD3|nr:hypothetical protein [Zongyangia hominis]